VNAMPVKYSIVIPAHNEEENLKPLASDLLAVLKGSDWEIILVDDNSTDGTSSLCDNLAASNPAIRCIHRSRGNNGMGYALREGTAAAAGEYVVWVMADRSDKLESILEMIAKLDAGADMVIASRYMSGGSRGDLTVEKALYGSIYTRLAGLIFGVPVHDITNAYRAFRRNVFDEVALEYGDFSISPEFAIKAQMRGFRLDEVPTTYFNRRAGQAKFKIFTMGVKYLFLFRLMFTYKGRSA